MKSVSLIVIILFNVFYHVAGNGNYDPLIPERIYLHTDRNTYIAGEYLFYKLYLRGNQGQTSRFAYLLIRDQKNTVVTHVRLEVSNQVSYGHILLSDTLGSGYYQILCYTNLMRNDEETIFTKEIAIANRFDEKLSPFIEPVVKTVPGRLTVDAQEQPVNFDNLIIHPDKQVYNPREEVTFSIETKNIKLNSIKSLSVSVSEIIPGIPDEPSISDYFGNNYSITSTTGSNSGVCRYYPEYDGAVLQGRVVTTPSSVIAGNQREDATADFSASHVVFLSTTDSIVNMQYSKTDPLGSFCFNLDPYYEGKEIIIKLKEKAGAAIDLDHKTGMIRPFIPSQRFNVQGIKEYMVRSGQIVQIHRYYNYRIAIDTLKSFLPRKTVPRIYYKHYPRIYPSDYVELKDFAEISMEIVPGLKVRKARDRFVCGYTNLQYRPDPDAEPAIFLDGIPIDDVNQIISLGTREIKSIETLPVIRLFGGLTFPGILSVISNNQAINNIQFKTPAVRYTTFSSRCYTKPESFNPASLNKNYPDLRQVLLWEPEYKPAGNEMPVIGCFASDLQGIYRINVQGMTSDNNPVFGSAVITIRSE